MTSIQRNTRPRYPGGWRALWGVAAYLAGFAVAWAVATRRAGEILGRTFVGVGGSDPITLGRALGDATAPEWVVGGWLFYDAHFVPLAVPLENGVATVNALTANGDAFLALLPVPVLAVAVAGAMAARDPETTALRFDLGDTAARRYAWNGALPVLFGYLPLAVVGLFAFVVAGVGPELLPGVFLVGLGYPVVFGAVGGLASYWVR